MYFQSENEADNLVVFVVPFFELFWSFGLVFITCELAGRVSSKFDDVDATVAQFKWYLFPYDVQKLLPTIISNAQQEVGIECFGSVLCNRETFQKVRPFEFIITLSFMPDNNFIEMLF